MSYPTAFRLSVYGLVLLGFVSLILSEELAAGFLILIPFSLVGAYWAEKRPDFSRALAPLNTYGFYPLVLFALIDFLYLSENFAFVFVNFTVLLSTVKLITPKTNRDWIQILALSFLQLLGASILSFDLYFAFVFLAFLLLSAWALTLLHFKSQWERVHGSGTGEEKWPPGALPWGLGVSISLLSLVVLAVTAATFLVLPRTQIGLMDSFISANYGRNRSLSGFSDITQLGGRGSIADDDRPVMRIGGDVDPADLKRLNYWKGVTLQHFNGQVWRVWRDTPQHSSFRQVSFADPPPRNRRWKLLELEVHMEASFNRYLFHHAWTQSISTQYMKLIKSPLESVYRKPKRDTNAYAYNVGVFLPETEPLVDAIDLSQHDKIVPLYLQLPEGLDPRIPALAKEIIQGVEGRAQRAAALERYLISNFTYDDEPPEVDPDNPLGDFLFSAQRGHCEYFASALAVLLRASYIPARVVNGYYGGEYNPNGNYLLIRRLHAHSWVEAYLPEHEGWVTLDGTPPDYRRERRETKMGWWTAWVDSIRKEWQDSVIDFSIRNQYGAISSLYFGLGDLRKEATTRDSKTRQKLESALGWIVGGVLALGASALLFLLFMRYVKSRFFGRDGRWSYYREMSEILERAGYERPPQRTSREFSEGLEGLPDEILETVRSVTEIYESDRYGGRSPDSKTLERLGSDLERLDRWRKEGRADS